ncbi:MAG: hypothetical protein ABUJ98_07800 [Hyphomicrobium sp.]
MASATARQGRPKGSGIDDSQQLARIAALLAADPKLKPTTAIRSLGIEDPSLIRRLRDKYRAKQAVSETNARQKATAKPKPKTAADGVENRETRATATASSNLRSGPSTNWNSVPADIFVAWCGFGLTAVSAAIENQHTFCKRSRRRTLHAN